MIYILVNFLIVQTAPGGPVEKFLAQLNHVNKAGQEAANIDLLASKTIQISDTKYRASQGVDAEIIAKIQKLYGFDRAL